MKILFLDQFSEFGGAQRCLLDLLPEIEARGWSASAAMPAGPLAERLRHHGIPVEEIPCGPYANERKSAADVLRFARDLGRQIRAIRGNYDLIYVNGPRLLPAVALVSRRRTPILFHAHHFIEQEQALRVTGCCLRQVRASVVACSGFVAKPLEPYAANRTWVIENGTPDCGFRRHEFSPERDWLVGMIGRISPEKGQAEFVAAASRLVPLFPRLRFSICGAPLFSSASYCEAVRRSARGLPVNFPGWRDDVNLVLRDLDLLVVPSKIEGMGRVIVEAFSAGVPVIATAVGGIPEVIADNVTGFLVKEPGAAALTARLREVIEADPQRLLEVTANARRSWEKRFTATVYRKRIGDLMAGLVLSPPAGIGKKPVDCAPAGRG